MLSKILRVIVCVLILAPNAYAQDFGGYRPSWQGFGTGATAAAPLTSTQRAGRGGEICRVNTLSGEVSGGGIVFGTTGTRSLADCVAPRSGCDGTFANCARFVLFETSGVICLDGKLTITSPYLTIAGQT